MQKNEAILSHFLSAECGMRSAELGVGNHLKAEPKHGEVRIRKKIKIKMANICAWNKRTPKFAT
jgi:hypothetical protein